ncbi:N-alpha-acetyltransferase 30 [Erpetoichthys calabaricus]|uniref:N-alpha-acetyltransferase 30 n=1 Tax=Erpetoichthys calabaricus TaxID=27687 RepID=A0A8C4TDY9_ERPCA|nr:N-alpha-acetyltransferase 30 [Erpetoichthys calabaricus]
MAEVPPGPSALPTSPAEVIPFHGAGRALPGEDNDEERVWSCGSIMTPGQGQSLPPEQEGKGLMKVPQNHLYLHSHALASAQQFNGIANLESGLLNNNHHHHHHHGSGCTLNYHSPASRPRDSESNCCSNSGHHCCPKNTGISGKLAPSRAETQAKADRGNEEERRACDRTDMTALPPPVHNDRAGQEGVEGMRPASLDYGAQDTVLELADALDAACTVREAVCRNANSFPSVGDNFVDDDDEEEDRIQYVRYESELQMPDIMRLITKDLSEPYSIYTYRYFIHNWPQLCFLAMVREECVGAIVCKLDMHKKMFRRGYIAMLAVDSKYRRKGIGTNLVKKAIYAMVDGDCDEVVLETEITNKSALKLYENLGFVRDKRLFRYYLNGVDALRLKLWLR